MEHVLKEAASSAQYGWMLGITTALFLLAFVGWTAWAWAPSHRDAMDRASRMPFDDED